MAEAAEQQANRTGAPISPSLQTHSSSLVEKVLEYRFLGEVTAELLRRGVSFDVLRSDVDCNGHDLVIEASGLVRHVQLKAMIADGRRASVTVSTYLAAKPSGCVIWMLYDPRSYELISFRWLGGAPGDPLPELGDQLARHTRGLKAPRRAHRVVAAGRFTPVAEVECLVDLLFGPCSQR